MARSYFFRPTQNVAGISDQIIYSGNGYKVKNRRIFFHQLDEHLAMDKLIRRNREKINLPLVLRLRLREITKQPSRAIENKPMESSNQAKKKKIVRAMS